jgi:hypothetical protein
MFCKREPTLCSATSNCCLVGMVVRSLDFSNFQFNYVYPKKTHLFGPPINDDSPHTYEYRRQRSYVRRTTLYPYNTQHAFHFCSMRGDFHQVAKQNDDATIVPSTGLLDINSDSSFTEFVDVLLRHR